MSEISPSLSKLINTRSRVVYRRKISQARHVKRMTEARLKEKCPSPGFVLPPYPQNDLQKTQDLKANNVLNTGHHCSYSSEILRQKDCQSAKKCLSNVDPRRPKDDWHSKHNSKQQNLCCFQHISAQNMQNFEGKDNSIIKSNIDRYCTQRSEGFNDIPPQIDDQRNRKVTSIGNGYCLQNKTQYSSSEQNGASGDKIMTFSIVNDDRKQIPIFSETLTSPIKTNHFDDLPKTSALNASKIPKKSSKIQCPKLNVSIQMMSPLKSSKTTSFLEKDVPKKISGSFSVEQIVTDKDPNSQQKHKQISNIGDACSQVKNHKSIKPSKLPKKLESSSSKISKETNWIYEDISANEVKKPQASKNTKFKAVSKAKVRTSRKYNRRKLKTNEKTIGVANEGKVSSKSQYLSRCSFTKTGANSKHNKNVHSSSTITLKIPYELKECLEMVKIETNTEGNQTKYHLHEIDKTESNESVQSKSFLNPNFNLCENKESNSQTPLATSRMNVEMAPIAPSMPRSRSKDQNQTSNSKLDYSFNISTNEAELDESQNTNTNICDQKVVRKNLPKVSTGNPLKTEKKFINEHTSISALKKSNNKCNDNLDFQNDSNTKIDEYNKTLHLTNIPCSDNSNTMVAAWLSNLPENSDSTPESKHTVKKINGNFNINTIDDSQFIKDTTRMKSNEKNQIPTLSKIPSLKNSNDKGNFKSQLENGSHTSILPSSSKSALGNDSQMKNRQSVVDADSLLGKMYESSREREFFESPIQKFMEAINSAFLDQPENSF